jgi:hypothetical protein
MVGTHNALISVNARRRVIMRQGLASLSRVAGGNLRDDLHQIKFAAIGYEPAGTTLGNRQWLTCPRHPKRNG